MSVCDFDLELRGVKLPDRESTFDDLSAEQIVEKINKFHERLHREGQLQVTPFAESYFLNLIALYPVSMCAKQMSDNLKLVAALFYYGSQPSGEEKAKIPEQEIKDLFPRNRPSHMYGGYTIDDLALIFDRSHGAIVEAVKQKKEQAIVMLEEAAMRCQRQESLAKQNVEALQKLTDDEKHEIVMEKAQAEEKKRTSLPC
jgi:hypothetical protein